MKLFLTIILLISTLTFVSCSKTQEVTMKTDREFIEVKFELLKNFESCYWITGNAEKNKNSATEDIWIQGYIVLSQEQLSYFSNKYTWSAAPNNIISYGLSDDTDTPIEPMVTGFANESFKWMENTNFKTGIMPKEFSGSIYFDTNNGVVAFGIRSYKNNRTDLNTLEYRTDIAPLFSSLKILEDIKSAYWKTDLITDPRIPGPNSSFYKGFILLEEDKFEKIKTEFNFEEIDLFFESGLNTSVTGFSEFNWGVNSEFTNQVLGNRLNGKIYFDTINGIVFFDVEDA